jgi:hypothetical protein
VQVIDIEFITGNSLLKKMVEASPEAISHWCAFDECDCHLHEDRLEKVKGWEIEYKTWVKEPTGSPCIFNMTEPCKSSFAISPQPQRLTHIQL